MPAMMRHSNKWVVVLVQNLHQPRAKRGRPAAAPVVASWILLGSPRTNHIPGKILPWRQWLLSWRSTLSCSGSSPSPQRKMWQLPNGWLSPGVVAVLVERAVAPRTSSVSAPGTNANVGDLALNLESPIPTRSYDSISMVDAAMDSEGWQG